MKCVVWGKQAGIGQKNAFTMRVDVLPPPKGRGFMHYLIKKK